MSKYFSETQKILEQNLNINQLIRKARIQRQALIATREHLKIISPLDTQQINYVYCDAKVLKIYCQNPLIASKIKPFTYQLLKHLQQANANLFNLSIQKVKILVKPITE